MLASGACWLDGISIQLFFPFALAYGAPPGRGRVVGSDFVLEATILILNLMNLNSTLNVFVFTSLLLSVMILVLVLHMDLEEDDNSLHIYLLPHQVPNTTKT